MCGVIFLVDLAHFRTQMTGVVEIPVRYRSDTDESLDAVDAVCYGLIQGTVTSQFEGQLRVNWRDRRVAEKSN